MAFPENRTGVPGFVQKRFQDPIESICDIGVFRRIPGGEIQWNLSEGLPFGYHLAVMQGLVGQIDLSQSIYIVGAFAAIE